MFLAAKLLINYNAKAEPQSGEH